MKFKSPVLASLSGSAGGLTFSGVRSGLQVRARSLHTNPARQRQSIVRSSFSSLNSMWSRLTADERLSWDCYASALEPHYRSSGHAPLSGRQHFLRCALPRLTGPVYIEPSHKAPVILNLSAPLLYEPRVTHGVWPDFLPYAYMISATRFRFRAAMLISDWSTSDVDTTHMQFFCTRGLAPSIHACRHAFSPWFDQRVDTFPFLRQWIDKFSLEGYTYSVGQTIFIRCQVARWDGRLSPSNTIRLTIQPPHPG